VPTIKDFTVSVSFILGCLFITVGSFGGVLFDLSWLSLLGLAFAMVHIIGLWMLVFFASEESMVLYALRLFRISAVLAMVLFCIMLGIIVISVLFSAFLGIVFLFVLGIFGGIGYLLVKHYFLALLGVLDGIRTRVETGEFAPLTGLSSFVIASYVLIGFNIVQSVFSMAGSYTPQMGEHSAVWQVDAFGNVVEVVSYTVIHESVYYPGTFNPGIIFVLISSLGMVLCLRVLKSYED